MVEHEQGACTFCGAILGKYIWNHKCRQEEKVLPYETLWFDGTRTIDEEAKKLYEADLAEVAKVVEALPPDKI